MDFKRKALGLAMSAVAAVAVGLTAAPASATDLGSATYYAANGGRAHGSRAERRAGRGERRHHSSTDSAKRRDGNYSREVERSKGDNSVGRTSTVTNEDTGNSVTRERTTSRDPETNAVTHTNTVSGDGGRTLSTSTTAVKTDSGHTATTTVTTPNGDEHTRTVDVSKDPGTQSATRTVTHTDASGDERTRESTITRTEDGYTRTTDFNGGATTTVTGTKDPDTGEWQRDVSRTRGDSSGTDSADPSSQVDATPDQAAEPPTKN